MRPCGLCGMAHEEGHPHLTMFVSSAPTSDPTVEAAEETFEEAVEGEDMYLGEPECQMCQSMENRCTEHQMKVPMAQGCPMCMGVQKMCGDHQMMKEAEDMSSVEQADLEMGMAKGDRCAACPGPPQCMGPADCLYKASAEGSDIFNPKCPLCKASGKPCGRHKPEGSQVMKSSNRLRLNNVEVLELDGLKKASQKLDEVPTGDVEKAANNTTAALQKCLVDVLALSMVVHQGHWVAKGDGFHPLHGLLGAIYSELEDLVDVIAERLAALDVAPAGQPADVAQSEIPALEPGFLDTKQLIVEVSNRMRALIQTLSSSRVVASSEDPVTENMLQDMIAKSDKLLWLLRSNAESAQAQ